MNRVRLLLLAAAVIAAVMAAYLSTALFQKPSKAPPPVAQKPATVDVLVAGRSVPPGERLGSLGLQWRAWPIEGVAPDMITKDEMPNALEAMQAARARTALLAGEPLVDAKVVRPGESGFLSAVLPGGMRAVAIPINEISSVSGFVLPNDRVDVILTRTITDQNDNKVAVSEAVITNVKVLAINQILGSGTDDATLPDGRTAVLELDPRQAEVMGKIIASGQISLALRSLDDKGDGMPKLADDYRNPRRAATGPLIIRYGLERPLRRP